MKKILLVFGTRPEAIKMAPLVIKLRENASFDVSVCVTGQHREMLDQVLTIFDIVPDYDLKVMELDQTLNDLTSKIIANFASVLDKEMPDLVIVHGDTTTSFASALCAYHKKIRVAHVEAGLRSGNIYSPWPEEGNRSLVAKLASFHFSPTERNKKNLIAEGIEENKIFVTGNTVIDSLLEILDRIKEGKVKVNISLIEKLEKLNLEDKIVLITGHRRENFGENFEEIFYAIKTLATRFPKVQFVYPVHLNPRVNQPARRILSEKNNIFLPGPLDYITFVYLMNSAYMVLTDSGGIQEEAPTLAKPVLVLRENTERPEGLDAGSSILVGHSMKKIISTVSKLLKNKRDYSEIANIRNPYGDGDACSQISSILAKNLSQE